MVSYLNSLLLMHEKRHESFLYLYNELYNFNSIQNVIFDKVSENEQANQKGSFSFDMVLDMVLHVFFYIP